jgi:hypothetical protein
MKLNLNSNPMSDPDPSDNLEHKRQILESWVKETQRRSEQLPHIQQGLDITNFQIKALASLPADAPPLLKADIANDFSKNTPYWEKVVATPLVPLITPLTGVSFEISSSNIAIQKIEQNAIAYPTISPWANSITRDYSKIQERYVTEAKITQKLSETFQKTFIARESEFRDAVRCFDRMIAKVDSQDAWGIKMRTFVDHVKGDMFDAAQKLSNKQKVNWEEFAGALALGGIGSAEYQSLVANGATYRDIKDKLSRLAKKEKTMSDDELRTLRTRIFDFVFSVLNLLNLKKLGQIS